MYYCCRLRAAVTIRTVEVNGRDAMFVKCAFECGAVIHRSGCVMSHTFTVAPLSVRVWGNRCATLEQECFRAYSIPPRCGGIAGLHFL